MLQSQENQKIAQNLNFLTKKNRVFNKKSCKLKTVHFNYDKHILSFMVMIFYNEIHNHITIWTLNGKK